MPILRSAADAAARDVEALAVALERQAAALRSEIAATRKRDWRRTVAEARRNVLRTAADALARGSSIEEAAEACRHSGGGVFDPDDILHFVRNAYRRGQKLKAVERNRLIMVRYRQGRSNAEIAAEFGLSKGRVSAILKAGKAIA
jgi:DNA-binding NarL/FixJ family response regulator